MTRPNINRDPTDRLFSSFFRQVLLHSSAYFSFSTHFISFSFVFTSVIVLLFFCLIRVYGIKSSFANAEELRERGRSSLAIWGFSGAAWVHSRLRIAAIPWSSPLLRSPLWSNLRHRRRAEGHRIYPYSLFSNSTVNLNCPCLI